MESQPALARPVSRSRVANLGLFVVLRVIGDVASVLIGFLIAYSVYHVAIREGLIASLPPRAEPYRALAALFAVVTVGAFWQLGLYRRRASVLNLWELQTAVRGMALASAAYFALLFFLKLGVYSRFVAIGGIAATTVIVLLERRMYDALYALLVRRGHFGRRVLIYGSGHVGQLLMKKIVQSPQTGWRVVGFLDDSARIGSRVGGRLAQTGTLIFEAPVLGRAHELLAVAERVGADELLIAVSTHPARLRELLGVCRERSIRVGIIPNFEDIRVDQLEVEDVSAIPVLRPQSQSPRLAQRAIKRAFDLVVTPLVLVATAPIWIVAAIWIRIDSPGPIFFAQERIGLRGRPFRILKFRTMWRSSPTYAHSPNGNVDPRITRIGRFLRRSGLDELPQLLNVLRGEMSLVGPRPEMPFLVEGYRSLERQRFQVKPGITGLWQLSVDRHAEIHENIEYDLYYVSHQSILLDALILLETVFFTAGLALRPRWRRGQGDDDRASTLPDSEPPSGERAVVLALDQRRGSAALAMWRIWVPAVSARAARWPVKVLVAGENVPTFDELIRQGTTDSTATTGRIDYVLYEDAHDLRVQVQKARLVITDLPHIETWARDAGVRLVRPGAAFEAPADAPLTDELLEPPVRVTREPTWNGTSPSLGDPGAPLHP